MPSPFVFISPATRGLSLALTRHYLRTTSLPVYATYRSGEEDKITEQILKPLKDMHEDRLNLLHLDLTCENTIETASQTLARLLKESGNSDPYMHTAFLSGGILRAERQPADLNLKDIQSSFQVNVIGHMLLIKHFSQFLPSSKLKSELSTPAKWVHVSARVGSISDNKKGGWYSYRASKAALNQVVKSFDLHLQMKGSPAMSVAVHPGTMKTQLSKEYWKSATVDDGQLFEPEESAKNLADVVKNLEEDQRGRIWDWEGKEILP